MAKAFPEIRIKIKSLADEARTIRKEELGLTGDKRAQLHNHRVLTVRNAARTALLAYAFLRGRKYRTIEPCTRWDRRPYDRTGPYAFGIAELIIRYGDRPDLSLLDAGHARKRAACDLVRAWIKEGVSIAKAA